jgi:hypothetical protein
MSPRPTEEQALDARERELQEERAALDARRKREQAEREAQAQRKAELEEELARYHDIMNGISGEILTVFPRCAEWAEGITAAKAQYEWDTEHLRRDGGLGLSRYDPDAVAVSHPLSELLPWLTALARLGALSAPLKDKHS